MARKNAGIISIGYRPEAPGTCRMTSATHTPLPTCMNVVERAKITDIYTSEVDDAGEQKHWGARALNADDKIADGRDQALDGSQRGQ